MATVIETFEQGALESLRDIKEIPATVIKIVNHQTVQNKTVDKQYQTQVEQYSEKPHVDKDLTVGDLFGNIFMYGIVALMAYAWCMDKLENGWESDDKEKHIQDAMSNDPRRRAEYEIWLHKKK